MSHGPSRLNMTLQVLQGMPIAVDAFRYGKIPDVTGGLSSSHLAAEA